MFLTKDVEELKTRSFCWVTFFSLGKSCHLWDNVEKYGRYRQATGDSIIRRMRVACWITKTADTYLLTTWCRVLLAKRTGLQLVKKFPAFHGTRRFITARTSVRHLSLSRVSPHTHSHLLEIRPNIIHPSTPRSPQWSLSRRFPHQDPIRPPLLTHTRHMPSTSHSSRFYHPHNIGWRVQII